ncbi:mechanosensitive ion channel family protein [Aquifex aeolicus]|uniref:Mechanosensitive ion channel n=1 Tax=Aquifex aeolicus (strain VF5) TaxID=224324 RepID=O67128_AQUAE|nr:mechanosensitive ion channel domain-containing protein [Aquifex aeolicus]AAC07093.1 hypothetical protein aq_1013 [Aquifex aeolicus VF5]
MSKTFTFLYKFSIALLLWIFLRTLFKVAIKRFKGSGFESVLNSLWFVLSASYVAFTGAWILNLVKFSVDFIVDVAVFFVIFLVYAAVFGYSVYLIGKFFGDTDGYENLLKSFKKFAYMFSIYILYKSLIYLTNIEVLVKKLERIYILETELVKISLFSFVEGIYVFFVLKYFFETLGNLFYVVYMKKDQEVEAGSFRTITVNLGLLLSLLIAGVSIGITWKAAVPIAGALGIGLGFGLQTIFNNYVSGFILLLSKNIKVGDYIEIEGKAGAAVGAGGDTIFGRVVSINILTTIVRTWDNVEVAIPNSEFLSSKIVNYSMTNPIVRVRIPFGVAYSSDPEKVREVLIRVAKRMPHVLPSPEPDVWFHEMGDSALIFILLVWVDLRRLRRLKALKSSIYYEAWKELKKEGIEIPFPQRDVWFRNKLKVEIEKDIKPEQ